MEQEGGKTYETLKIKKKYKNNNGNGLMKLMRVIKKKKIRKTLKTKEES